MPKLIDYPRTTYTSAWELSEIVDNTGGKCTTETAARKLNRRVSGSFKAIVGSAVKFGLMTCKRELLSTTTLFRRIKHAYDKKEELLFHREAFLTPPLFTQLCRKFRSRELPVQMLDIILIREFNVEEINAQAVSKAFTEGARQVELLNEQNIMADIDQATTQRAARRELASPTPALNTFRGTPAHTIPTSTSSLTQSQPKAAILNDVPRPTQEASQNTSTNDAIAELFGFKTDTPIGTQAIGNSLPISSSETALLTPASTVPNQSVTKSTTSTQPLSQNSFQLQLSGPGMDTTLSINDEDDLKLAQFLLEKIRRQLSA